MSDRKIDEELGSTHRFQCAAEELTRCIRSFGEGKTGIFSDRKLTKLAKFKLPYISSNLPTIKSTWTSVQNDSWHLQWLGYGLAMDSAEIQFHLSQVAVSRMMISRAPRHQ